MRDIVRGVKTEGIKSLQSRLKEDWIQRASGRLWKNMGERVFVFEQQIGSYEKIIIIKLRWLYEVDNIMYLVLMQSSKLQHYSRVHQVTHDPYKQTNGGFGNGNRK